MTYDNTAASSAPIADAAPAESPSASTAVEGLALQDTPERFLNRDLSWLAFNRRVLEEACNPAQPLLERLRFLSICANNQEEFFMVRIAGLKAAARMDAARRSPDGLTARQQLEILGEQTKQFARDLNNTWLGMRAELETAEIFLRAVKDLSDEEKNWAAQFFRTEIFPTLTPIAVDTAHPFPFVPNKGMALALRLENRKTKSELKALISLPQSLQRFIRLPGPQTRYLLLEDMTISHITELFPEPLHLKDHAVFRVLRDSEIEIEDEADDLFQTFEIALKRRRRGNVIRLTVNDSISADILDFLVEYLEVKPHDVLLFGDLVGLADVKEMISNDKPDLLFRHFEPRFPERIREFDGDCFAAIRHKDIVVHHPYESFDVVVQFIRQAARDPDVISIKQTIYRTSRKSAIVDALIEAAENGKSVTALVELKARFDEEANLRWARDMEKAGVQVVFGFIKLKTHAKISLVTRREAKTIVNYVHFGTGNYHADTARVYTDLSFFTCAPDFCHDAALLFNYMTGYAVPQKLSRLSVAPIDLRKTLKTLIDVEIENARAGKNAQIWAKCNSLADPEIIDCLYKASQAGVRIELVVRGICTLRPGIPGLSENIRVKSIVGRFLEHARIYCFAAGNTLPSPQAKVFISSADVMPRNLDYRVEALVPVIEPTVHRQVLDQIMMANLKDQVQSWIMQPDGTYVRQTQSKTPFSAHDYFMNNPSLSGRGKALRNIPIPPLSLDRDERQV